MVWFPRTLQTAARIRCADPTVIVTADAVGCAQLRVTSKCLSTSLDNVAHIAMIHRMLSFCYDLLSVHTHFTGTHNTTQGALGKIFAPKKIRKNKRCAMSKNHFHRERREEIRRCRLWALWRARTTQSTWADSRIKN